MKKRADINDFNPYPGLRPFAPEDSELFFGRDAESDEVILKLLKNRYVTVIGASGTGKSSLIYGGVQPKIMNLKIRESSVWKTISFRPGNDPFVNLASALSSGISDQRYKKIDKNEVLSELNRNPVSLSDIVRRFLPKREDNVLFIIDQFEELFRYNPAGKPENANDSTKKFIDFLVNSVIKPDVNIFILISLRSEYIGECSHFKGLTMLVNNSNYLVPDMSAENFREVIEGPLNFTGVMIDPKLTDTLLSDINKVTFRLPVLQHALMRTWAHWKELDQPDRPINKNDYEMVGALHNSITLHADELYEELDQRGKEICAILFKTIARKSPENKGLRNPSNIETIRSIARCQNEDLIAVIDKFRNESHSFLSPPMSVPLNEKVLIDLHHECLVSMWDRLKFWVDEEASSRDMYIRLSDSSALYQQGKACLLRPPDLQPALDWREKQKPLLAWAVQYNPAFERAMVYLRTSEKAFIEEEQNKIRLQQRKVKRTRLITRILSVAVFMAIGFVLYAYAQKFTAERQAALTEKQRIKAVTDKELADSFALIVLEQKIISDSTADASVKEAEEARKLRVDADVQKSVAEKNASEALLQKKLMTRKADSLRTAGLRAELNAKTAIEEKNETQRLRMISIGRSMSLKSLQLNGQQDLQTLLAYQAYQFNKKNIGQVNDADIYAGLYNVALQYNNRDFHSFKGHTGDIKSIAFLPGKNEFFTSGNDGQVLKWSLDKKDQTLQVVYSGSDIIEVLAVSPDASWLACGSSNSSIRMIPLKGNIPGYEMTGHKGGIKSLIFSYDGKYLYSAALDGKVLKWDIAARTSMNVTSGSMEITSIDISSKGNYLAGISPDGKVIVWDPDHKSDNFRIETTGKNIKVARFNPETNLLALGDAEGSVELWDIGLRKKISEVKAHSGEINDIEFNTALKQMATSGPDKNLKIYDINNPADLSQPPVTIADNEGLILVMQFSPDGQMIVSGESGANGLKSRPSNSDYLVRDICNLISRNLTQEEWNIYVAKDIPLQKTCQGKNLNIKIEPIKGLTRN
jgi:WD40 repeat protein